MTVTSTSESAAEEPQRPDGHTLLAQLVEAYDVQRTLERQLYAFGRPGNGQAEENNNSVLSSPLSGVLDSVCLSPEEVEQRDGTCDPVLPLPLGAGELRGLTLDSLRRAAEQGDLKATLALIEDVGDGSLRAMCANWGFRVLYMSSAMARVGGAPSNKTAVQSMNANIAGNAAVRSTFAGYIKLLMVGRQTGPAMTRIVFSHKDRPADLVCYWFVPVLLYDYREGDEQVEASEHARGRATGMCGSDADRPHTRLCFLTLVDLAYSAARQHEGMLRDHMALKYTPNPVTMVDEEGVIVVQNAASASAIGIHGYEARLPGSPRLNYLAELFYSDPEAEEDMRKVTATGRTWARRLRISDSPALRKWLLLRGGEERWHDVQISRLRDPFRLVPAYIVAKTDATATVMAERQVDRLHRQQQGLLRQILPQQVIDAMLAEDREDDDAGEEEKEEDEGDAFGDCGVSAWLCRGANVAAAPLEAMTPRTASATTLGTAPLTNCRIASAAAVARTLSHQHPNKHHDLQCGAPRRSATPRPSRRDLRRSRMDDRGSPPAPEPGRAPPPQDQQQPGGQQQPEDAEGGSGGSAIQLTKRQVMSLATWHDQITSRASPPCPSSSTQRG